MTRFRRSLWYSWILGFIEGLVMGTKMGQMMSLSSAVLVFEMIGNMRVWRCSQLVGIQKGYESLRPQTGR